MNYEYQLETKLRNEDPMLHRLLSDNILACQNMLLNYQAVFPTYTDHTVLHSLEVIAFCNNLVGDNIELLNVDEIFILLMSAYLHDAGMGISEQNFEVFSDKIPMVKSYLETYPDFDKADVIRKFHNEFSGAFIKKYAVFFDFPSEQHLFGVIQVSRGHRKTDLYDEAEYPAELILQNGNPVRLPYLASLIRLADELDIAVDRNLQFLYDVDQIENKISRLEFEMHQAIKRVDFKPDRFVVAVQPKTAEIEQKLKVLFVKLKNTLDYCIDVVEKRTPFKIDQRTIEISREALN